MLKVEKLSIAYGGVKAVDNAFLTVHEDEIVAVIGANGAGKTSLLKAISGLLKPIAGSIEFSGQRVQGLPAYEICKRGIVQVPEGRQLFPGMKVLHNLQMGAYLPEARKRLDESLKMVYQLFPVLERRQSQLAGLLSGGEQQMLAVARALMSVPKLLMLDEPSEGLSPLLTANVFDTLKVLREQGLTILLVSQEVELSLALSNRAYVFENGRVTLEGKSSDLLNDDKVREAYLGM
jgi:branched-chain amino acid transport system ATP-binding protein